MVVENLEAIFEVEFLEVLVENLDVEFIEVLVEDLDAAEELVEDTVSLEDALVVDENGEISPTEASGDDMNSCASLLTEVEASVIANVGI